MNREDQDVCESVGVWAPSPKQKLSEWAEENFVLSPEYSAHSGQLKLYKFQREILDAFTDPYVRQLIAMTSTQLVKTLLQQIAVAYVIARAPGPILWAHPTATDAETVSKERLAPMIRDMECLRTRVAPERKTSKDNTITHKSFPGGSLSLIGAQTAGEFARRSIRYFFADERDKWKANVGKEGDGFSLGVKRTATFRSLAKIVQACSPTIEGNSQIARAYEDSDQRKFWIPCPECGGLQILRWGQVRFDTTNPLGTTRYECEHCKRGFSDVARWDRCEIGLWRPDAQFAGTAGFWISELYSPWKKLSDIASDFLAKKDNPAELQTFINTSLAETWREQGEAPDHEKLMARREPSYRLGQVPPGVAFLTAGVDVQKTWLEGYVWGWGRDRQRWVVDHFRIEHGPFEPAAWDELTEHLNRSYQSQDKRDLSVVRFAIDMKFGDAEVKLWARQQGSGRVMLVIGASHRLPAITVPPRFTDITVSGKTIKRGQRAWQVDGHLCKSELYGLLGKDRPAEGEPYPGGWVHFPSDCDEEFFKQLTAECLQAHVVKGYRKTEWVKTRERNEALDCAVYARAAAFAFGLDRRGHDERWWAQLEGGAGQPQGPRQVSGAAPESPTDIAVNTPPAPGAWRDISSGGWLGDRAQNWRFR